MFKANTASGHGHTTEALSIDKTVALLKAHRVLHRCC
jgi:hypothetical protein